MNHFYKLIGFLFIVILMSIQASAQKGEFAIFNFEKQKSKFFVYHSHLVFKLKDGKLDKYPIVVKSRKETVFHGNLIFHSRDSLYFKDNLVISYHDLDWYYFHSFGASIKKLIGLSGLTLSLISFNSQYYSSNLVAGAILMAGAWLYLDNLNSDIIYTKDWQLVIPERKMEIYQKCDSNSNLVYELLTE